MANKSITLKRNNNGTVDILYPTTIPEQVEGLLTDGKITADLLPSSVVGGMRFAGTISGSLDIDDITGDGLNQLELKGEYLICTGGVSLTQGTTVAGTIEEPGDEGDHTLPLALEEGDWLIAITDLADDEITLAVINNTYRNATSNQKGIVELATNTETAAGTDTTLAVTPAGLANVLSSYSQTDTDRYVNEAEFEVSNGVLTLTRAGSDNETVTVDLDGRYLTAESTDFKSVAVTDTDAGFTWGQTGSAIASTVGDTLTVVSGSAIDVDVDANNDAIRISHADTSQLDSGAQGTSGIASITLDDFGHITAITTATYNDYSLPLAADGTRGGLQIGFTDTETSRGLKLSTEEGKEEEAYITLPRQIPLVTLNGGTTATPSFYAPASVGEEGQILQSNGSGAPSWINYTPVVYGDLSDTFIENLDSGTIVFELDAA